MKAINVSLQKLLRGSNYGRGSPKELSYQLWLKSAMVMEEMFEVFFVFLAVAAILKVRPNNLSNSGKRLPKEQFYQVWLKSAKELWRRCSLKFFISVVLATILCTKWNDLCNFCRELHTVVTILSSLVEIHQVVAEKMSFEFFLFLCSGAEQYEQFW